MSRAIITSRSLRNIDTGIDISVPEYKEVANLLGLSKEEQFNIIVISKLPYFKRECHKPQDIVQFMVVKKFSEFEIFRKAMDEQFSATVFPELPKKSFVLSEEGAANKRRAACEKLLQFIASSSKTCCSHLFLEFLGVKGTKIKEVEERTISSKEESESLFKKVKVKSTSSDLFGEGDNSDEDLFGDLDTDRPEESDDLFTDERRNTDSNQEASDKPPADHTVRLFGEDETGTNDGIYLPLGATGDNSDLTEVSEDMSDLLNIEDDLDSFLKEAKPKPKRAPTTTTVKKDYISPLDAEKDATHVHTEVDLDNDDILKYIADNEEAPSDSLF